MEVHEAHSAANQQDVETERYAIRTDVAVVIGGKIDVVASRSVEPQQREAREPIRIGDTSAATVLSQR